MSSECPAVMARYLSFQMLRQFSGALLVIQNENTISTVQAPYHSLEEQTIKTFSSGMTNDCITAPSEGCLRFFEHISHLQ